MIKGNIFYFTIPVLQLYKQFKKLKSKDKEQNVLLTFQFNEIWNQKSLSTQILKNNVNRHNFSLSVHRIQWTNYMLMEISEYCCLPSLYPTNILMAWTACSSPIYKISLSYLKERDGIHTRYEWILIYSGTKESKLYLKFYHIQIARHVNGVLPLSVQYEAELLRQNLRCIS